LDDLETRRKNNQKGRSLVRGMHNG
jgi:hypothetical protein